MIVRCSSVRKDFEGVPAVQDITFQVEKGEVFGLVGPDGAGKTTTIRMMCGIMPPTSGEIEVMGASLPNEAGDVISEIGYMSQRFSLYGDLTVAENIRFFADIHQVSASERRANAEQLLHASRLEPYQKRLAGNLSGGMKQKLALVCTLIHTPKILFLDEPTTGVDPISRREFWQILYGLVAEGLTLIVSTPYMDEADRCQRLAFVNRGRLLMCDTPENLRRSFDRSVIEVHIREAESFGSPGRIPNSQLVREFLQDLPDVLSVESFGPRLHATVRNDERAESLIAALEESRLPYNSARVVAHSLEDAFIARLEERETTLRV